nr:unnamed protein product [Digitaria exilis]
MVGSAGGGSGLLPSESRLALAPLPASSPLPPAPRPTSSEPMVWLSPVPFLLHRTAVAKKKPAPAGGGVVVAVHLPTNFNVSSPLKVWKTKIASVLPVSPSIL